MHAGDLVLASACAAGNSGAITAFEIHYADILRGVLRRFSGELDLSAELQQNCVHLFVDDCGSGAKISEYTGRGRLENWLRVVALRVCLNAIRGENPAAPQAHDGEAAVAELEVPGADHELAFLQAQYRQSFRSAFAAATASLSAAHCAVLRLGLVHSLTADQLAAALGVHRATAARRLERARRQLIEATLEQLKTTLQVSDSELASIRRPKQPYRPVAVTAAAVAILRYTQAMSPCPTTKSSSRSWNNRSPRTN